MKKKQISVSLDHPVIMYGYLGAQNEAEHKEAVSQWQLNFTSSLEGKASDEFCYDKVVFLRNVNICAYSNLDFEPNIQLDDLPIFHAGVVFMHDEYPTWLYLFESDEDMNMMLKEYPPDDLVLENGESCGEACSRLGIRFLQYDGRKEAKYTPKKMQSTAQCEECNNGELFGAVETEDALTGIERCAILSLPGWPSRELRDGFYAAATQVIEQQLAILPEPIRELYRGIYCNQTITAPTVYRIPLPDAEYMITNVAISTIELEDGSEVAILVQNDLLFEYDLQR